MSQVSQQSIPTMESTCQSCGEGTVVADLDSSTLVCTSCSRVHGAAAAKFVHQTSFTDDSRPDTRVSSFVHHHSHSPRHDRKLADAFVVIAACLDLSPTFAEEALRMAESTTAGIAFLPALAAACAYLVTRSHRLPLSLAEAVPCIAPSLADLASRFASCLTLPSLPSFDYDAGLERAVRFSFSLHSTAVGDKADVNLTQARFLLHYASKWSLTSSGMLSPSSSGSSV